MNHLMAKKLEMAARVQEFEQAHPYTDRNQAAVATQFAERLAQAQSLFLAEHKEQRAASAAAHHRQGVRRGLETHVMSSVVRIGAFATRGDAQAARHFTAQSGSKSNAAFLRHASSLLEVGRAHQEPLTRNGLPRGTLSEFAAGLSEFREAEAQAQSSRRQHRETRVALGGAIADLTQLLNVLDVYNRGRFRDDALLLSTWSNLRTVGRPATRRRSDDTSAAPPNPSGTVSPPVIAPSQPAPVVSDRGDDGPPRDGGQTRAA